MPDHVSDRNMLFGILAQQMDFISRDALINAMHAWVQRKQTPMGQILLEQNALTPDTHALLDAMVNKHLQMHGNDVERSLAAISSLAAPVRKQFEQLADADVQASLVHIARDRLSEEPTGATVSFGAGKLSAEGLRFRILRPHAKGGLGMVYVAHDEELHRVRPRRETQGRDSFDRGSCACEPSARALAIARALHRLRVLPGAPG